MIENTEDYILDKVTSIRWIISVLFGLIWGVVGLKGIFGLALYGIGICAISVSIVKNHR
jgi:hypothetical protein